MVAIHFLATMEAYGIRDPEFWDETLGYLYRPSKVGELLLLNKLFKYLYFMNKKIYMKSLQKINN